MTFAVVLGGGGSAGLAWEIGVLAGLAAAGLDAGQADTLVGTSAGAIASVQLRSGAGLPALYERACAPTDAQPMDLDFAALSARWAEAARGAASAADARARIGRLALDSDTMPAEQRREQIRALLPADGEPASPADGWPARPVIVTAVSATTGSFRVFAAGSGADLLSAVSASCAVPGVWPPVLIGSEYFIDGAVRSPTNVFVAAGHSSVLVIAPMLPALGGGMARELDTLGPDAVSAVIAADEAAIDTFGPNPLDATCGPAAAAEGLRQGRTAAPRVAALLSR